MLGGWHSKQSMRRASFNRAAQQQAATQGGILQPNHGACGQAACKQPAAALAACWFHPTAALAGRLFQSACWALVETKKISARVGRWLRLKKSARVLGAG